MKKIILIAISAASIPAYALPTYEPFTEYASQIALQGTTYTASSNGVPLGTNASGSVSNAIDLATNGLTAPSGENWTALKFGGTTSVTGLDVYVVSNTSIFTSSGSPASSRPLFRDSPLPDNPSPTWSRTPRSR